MNLDIMPIGQAIDKLPSHLRAWFDELLDAPYLADATTEEVFLMVWAVGYLSGVLNGAYPFDRAELMNLLNIRAQNGTKRHKNHGTTTAVD